jgi:DNA-binding LacI/PurR family transcriptional regulator
MNDRTIPGIIQAINERGWHIPDDFSLMSVVSSARAAEMMVPPLTTMDPPTAEMGRLGVELLIQQLEGQTQNESQLLLPCTLVVRDSSGPNRQNLETQVITRR